jgi:hypothetical protein
VALNPFGELLVEIPVKTENKEGRATITLTVLNTTIEMIEAELGFTQTEEKQADF